MIYISNYKSFINEKLICTLDLGAGESILEIPINGLELTPTIGEYYKTNEGNGIFVVCNNRIYHFREEDGEYVNKVYTIPEFEENFDSFSHIDVQFEPVRDKIIIDTIAQFFSDPIDVYIEPTFYQK